MSALWLDPNPEPEEPSIVHAGDTPLPRTHSPTASQQARPWATPARLASPAQPLTAFKPPEPWRHSSAPAPNSRLCHLHATAGNPHPSARIPISRDPPHSGLGLLPSTQLPISPDPSQPRPCSPQPGSLLTWALLPQPSFPSAQLPLSLGPAPLSPAPPQPGPCSSQLSSPSARALLPQPAPPQTGPCSPQPSSPSACSTSAQLPLSPGPAPLSPEPAPFSPASPQPGIRSPQSSSP